MADPDARQAAWTAAPAHGQPVIRHYLAWRAGMGALRAILRKSEPSTRVN